MSNNIPQKPYKPLTPFGIFVKHNFPFIEATYEARDNYDLLSKVVEHLNTVEYNQGIAQENLEALYNFLDTLELQDEVNNKLDEMVQDGTLNNLMAPYINNYINPLIDEQASKIDILRDRMDTFTHLTEGSTTGDAELIDIRVGANGVTYDTAGNAVRGQYQTLLSEINKGEETVPTLIFAQWVNGQGFNTDTSTIRLNSVGPATVLRNTYHDLIINTDFSKYRISLYYFSSQTNKYPHFEGNYRQTIRVPKNQWFTFFVNNHDNSDFTEENEIDYIRSVTSVTNGNDLWTQINENTANIQTNTNDINQLKLIPEFKNTEIETIKKYATGNQIQGMTVINNNFLLFSGSSSDPEGYEGKIFVINKETGTVTENFHNFGHASSCSYVKMNDTLIMGNGSLQTTDKPKIQFMQNASQKTNMYQNNADYFEIPFYTNDNELLYNGYCNIVTIGEDYRTVYMAVRNSSGYKMYKIILGVGTANYSDQWGSYVYRGENNYNGTAKVIETIDFSTAGYSQPQCFIYKHGCFYVLDGVTTIKIHKVQLLSNLTFKELATYTLPANNDEGTPINTEPEGLTFINNIIYESDYNATSQFFRLNETGII